MSRAELTRALKAEAKRLGATLKIRPDREGLDHEAVCEAPRGMVWRCSAVHELVSCGSDGDPMDDVLTNLLTLMRDGVEPCDDPECEWCAEAPSNGV